MTGEVILKAATYGIRCPTCGRTRYVTEPTRFVECECGQMIVAAEPKHRFPTTIAEPGVPVVVSYRWQCLDCGRTNYESSVTESVRCPKCGSTFGVAHAEHNGVQKRLL